MRTFISSGSNYEAEVAYSRAVVDEHYVHVSGTTGFDYATMEIADDVVAQAEQCFRTIAATLAEAGASLADVVRVRYIVPKVAVLAARPERLAANPHEVDTILHVSLDELTAPDVHRCEIWSRPPQRYEVNFFFLFGDTVWGATGRILRQLLCVSLGLDDDPDVIER